jgi:hypothetical protein
MVQATLESLIVEYPGLAPVVADAAKQDIRVGRLLGAGGYSGVFEATSPRWGESVLKIAGLEFAGPVLIDVGELGPYRGPLPHSVYHISGPSKTGPLFPSAPATLEQANWLLEGACRRQQRVEAGDPLARLHALLDLDGRAAALLERLHGQSLRSLLAAAPGEARGLIPAMVRALMVLHDTFGEHGDLKPDHIFVENSEVRFIDPLPEESGCIGSLGYALPCMVWGLASGRLKDLGSLAAILAELWGGTVGWDEELILRMANLKNGRFACRDFKVEHVLDRMRDGTTAVPPPVRSWILDIGQGILDTLRVADTGRPGDPGWCRSRLEALASALCEVSSTGLSGGGTTRRALDQDVERTVILDSADIASMLPFEARYEIRRRLWHDGPHAGWDAYDRVLRREVVLNVAYRPTDAPCVVEKARTLAHLRHPNILPVLDLGVTSQGLPFFTTPKMECEPLDSLLQRLEGSSASGTEPVPLKPLVGGVLDVCRAVEYARRQGIVNRDLYPGSILVGTDFRDVIVLGWERIRDGDAAGDVGGHTLGCLAYASPERVRERSPMISPASDVFNLGGVLHLVLYATPPNHLGGGVRALDLFRAIVEGRFEPRKPGELRPGVRPRGIWGRRVVRHLEQICLKALDGHPERRHRDAGELGRDLDTWLGLT